MKFDDLDQKMRVFETAHDLCVLPGLYIVARLDGRGFTRLTKEVHRFEAPLDPRFRDFMLSETGFESPGYHGIPTCRDTRFIRRLGCLIQRS